MTAAEVPPSISGRHRRYLELGRTYHRYRLGTAVGIAAVLTAFLVTDPGRMDFLATALVAAGAGVHAWWRVRTPGRTALDGILVDAVFMLAVLTEFRPPIGATGIAVIYVGIPAALFVSTMRAALLSGVLLIGATAVGWLIPVSVGRPSVTVPAALALAAATPAMLWLAAALARSLAGDEWAEERLSQATRDYERLFDGLVLPAFRSDPAGFGLAANPALMDLFEVSSLEEFTSHPISVYYADPSTVGAISDRLTSDGEVRGMEVAMRSARGRLFWARLSCRLVDATPTPFLEGVVEDVTAERAATKQLQAMATALDQVASAVAVVEPDGTIVSWNQHAEAMFGTTSLEAVGRDINVILRPVDPQLLDRALAECRRTWSWSSEMSLLNEDETTLETAFSVTRLTEPDGTPDGMAMVWTDLTDIVRSRRELDLRAAVLDQARDAMIVLDDAQVVVDWNQAAERIFGVSTAAAIGQPARTLLIPADPTFDVENCLRNRDTPRQMETTFLRPDGERFIASCGTSPVHLDGGVSRMVVVIGDVTEQRRHEAQARAQADLARTIIDVTPNPVAVIDTTGTIIDVNNAWREFGAANGGQPEATGNGMNYLDICDAAASSDPDAAVVAAGIRGVLRGRSRRFQFEYSCDAPGEQRWFLMDTTPIPGVGAVVSHWNTTADHLARHSLEEIIRAKDEFLTAVAHHLRTPMTAVVGFSEHLRAGDVGVADQAEMIDTIAEQAAEVAELLEDLMLVGRLDSETLVVRPEPVTLHELIHQVVRPWVSTGRMKISIAVDPLLTAVADPLRVKQILRNLVSNAIRHGHGPIRITARRQGTTVAIQVIDHGTGVPGYAEATLFTPYAHLPAHDGSPATLGIGLQVSRRLAKYMDGNLAYRRTKTTTVFTLTLPAVAEAGLRLAASGHSPKSLSESNGTGAVRQRVADTTDQDNTPVASR